MNMDLYHFQKTKLSHKKVMICLNIDFLSIDFGYFEKKYKNKSMLKIIPAVHNEFKTKINVLQPFIYYSLFS
jgi:hypothetical protein